ncbi:MAG: hypothetical protein WCC63_02595 [Candidatus Bathyarchaeia archaeon]
MGSAKPAKCRVCRKRDATTRDLCDQCRNTRLAREIHEGSLPWLYRLLLRLPGVSRIERASGLFWVLVVPILVFLNVLLSLVLLLMFPFPLNILLVAVVPASLLAVFVRLGLERFINLWNLIVATSAVEWNIEKSTKEYIELLESQGRGEGAKSPPEKVGKAQREECE